jgi:hypothetical protein
MPDEGLVFVGADEAAADFRRWAQQVGPAVDKESRAFAARVAARVHPPVLTGALAASVNLVELPELGAGVSIGDGLDYAGWIEFGGSRGRPHISEGRYLYPTAQAAEADWYGLAETTATDTAERYPWTTTAA